MNLMGCKSILTRQVWVGFAALIFYTLPVQAQFVPGPYYYPDMGVMGTVASAYQSAAQSQAYSANRQLQATTSMARSAAWQSINRSMQSQAASQPTSVPDSAQSARDWMFQNTASSRPARRPMTLPSAEMAVVTTPQETAKPAAQREIMLWPTLLKQQQFDEDRAGVEAPFRRANADGKPLTVEDYEGIIKTVENMKAAVKNMESQIVETEYNSVQKYLDDLIADSQKRIKARE